jgi:hypothetical protein
MMTGWTPSDCAGQPGPTHRHNNDQRGVSISMGMVPGRPSLLPLEDEPAPGVDPARVPDAGRGSPFIEDANHLTSSRIYLSANPAEVLKCDRGSF